MNPSSRIRAKWKDVKKRQKSMRLRRRTDLALNVCTARPFPSLIGAFLTTSDLLSICLANREWAIAFFDPTIVSTTYSLRPRSEEQKWPSLKCQDHSDALGQLCSACLVLANGPRTAASIESGKTGSTVDRCASIRHLNQGLSCARTSPFEWRRAAFQNLWRKWALKGFVNVEFVTDERLNRALGIDSCDPKGPMWKVNNDAPGARRIFVNLHGRLVLKVELARPSPKNILHAIRFLQWLDQVRFSTWIEEPRDPNFLHIPVRYPETIQHLEMRQFVRGSDGRFILTKESSPFIPHRTMFFSEFIMLERATVRLPPGVVIYSEIPIRMASYTSIVSLPASDPVIRWGNFSWHIMAQSSFTPSTITVPPPPKHQNVHPSHKNHQIPKSFKNRPLQQPHARGKRRG